MPVFLFLSLPTCLEGGGDMYVSLIFVGRRLVANRDCCRAFCLRMVHGGAGDGSTWLVFV
jgi:hypothetical protein